ncbi:uncharacterized protein MJAP1_002437 [Malassezia japonica]|uniref:Dolichyl-diphosphooligosaccharide-protein glycosyltransferase subunit OST5 n=1 Tax=Malassezia japonica TaxID=223818 RepID=A0AAF0EYR8_9BASI|nr:uncharacterized protein MJAP1_002437 [Malassezia japonica]WFD39460.1 hypothetical protein MJAP1_002437 [Malassezia japonica]
MAADLSAYQAVQVSAIKLIQDAFRSAPDLRPLVPVDAMAPIAAVCLGMAFVLAFYFTMLPGGKLSLSKNVVGLVGSLFAGAGVVALFNAVGVYV